MCLHRSIIGDNYGDSCADCGKQLHGYGHGGWFGRNLTESPVCIHVFAPMGKGGTEICVYCETINPDRPLEDDEFTSWHEDPGYY